jgi:hypothetical protein
LGYIVTTLYLPLFCKENFLPFEKLFSKLFFVILKENFSTFVKIVFFCFWPINSKRIFLPHCKRNVI